MLSVGCLWFVFSYVFVRACLSTCTHRKGDELSEEEKQRIREAIQKVNKTNPNPKYRAPKPQP